MANDIQPSIVGTGGVYEYRGDGTQAADGKSAGNFAGTKVAVESDKPKHTTHFFPNSTQRFGSDLAKEAPFEKNKVEGTAKRLVLQEAALRKESDEKNFFSL